MIAVVAMVMKGLVGAMERPQPVVICGPSGVGKGTLIGKLMKEFPETFGFSVSHTTRKPRAKEVDGVHYHFATRSVMAQDIEEGKFLESAEVHGNLYGTSWAAVKDVSDAGKVRMNFPDLEDTCGLLMLMVRGFASGQPHIHAYIHTGQAEEVEYYTQGLVGC